MPAVTIGDYWAEGGVVTDYPELYTDDPDKEKYAKFPTVEEVGRALGYTVQCIDITTTFYDCANLVAAPRLPDRAVMNHEGSGYGIFSKCTKLKIAPSFPKQIEGDKSAACAFYKCSDIMQAPVIQKTIIRTDDMFYLDAKLLNPVSIPKSLVQIPRMFQGCTVMSGEMVIRPSSLTSYSNALKDTTGSITIYGDQAVCQSVAATANNGNAAWSAWYDPVPAVTNRGPGSKTTAADMTRMVRNGALAVDTYAPGRMVYQQGDIVREDEWIALVEAAQTIDSTVTLSTHYNNLNKIEAAFESAL